MGERELIVSLPNLQKATNLQTKLRNPPREGDCNLPT
jgi:hypothetical protein